MAKPRPQLPSLLVIVCCSRHAPALAWARTKLETAYGPVGLVSPDFDFHFTRYYETDMGTELKKRFLVFSNLVDPACLADVKLHTNRLEEETADAGPFAERRPLNLDPGLLQLGKFMLATVKDKDHRIYLGDGIFAEVTLRFTAGNFEPWPWTYADYREDNVRSFLKQARDYYRQRLEEAQAPA